MPHCGSHLGVRRCKRRLRRRRRRERKRRHSTRETYPQWWDGEGDPEPLPAPPKFGVVVWHTKAGRKQIHTEFAYFGTREEAEDAALDAEVTTVIDLRKIQTARYQRRCLISDNMILKWRREAAQARAAAEEVLW